MAETSDGLERASRPIFSIIGAYGICLDCFENEIVFGSSISPADYFYFFPVIDSYLQRWEKDSSFSGKIFFLFSTSYEKQINKRKLLDLLQIGNVRKLFQSYAENKGIKEANRLLGINFNKQKIIIESID